jgi:hypothetical protein
MMPKKGYKQTEEHERRISESKVGKKRLDVSERMKNNNPMKRPEVAEKVSKALTGVKKSLEATNKMRKALTGVKKSLEAKKRMSEARTGDRNPMKRPEVRTKMKTTLRKHHVYLKGNGNETIELRNSKHVQLHYGAYEYIYCKYGKEGVDDFLRWFDEKYGLV